MVYIIHLRKFNFISGTKIAYKKYIELTRMFKIAESYFPFPKSVSLSASSSFLLMILPTGSDL